MSGRGPDTGAPFDAAASVGALPAARPAPASAFTRFCAAVSKGALALAIAGLVTLIVAVQFQVVGRYVFNDTPTWAEAQRWDVATGPNPTLATCCRDRASKQQWPSLSRIVAMPPSPR